MLDKRVKKLLDRSNGRASEVSSAWRRAFGLRSNYFSGKPLSAHKADIRPRHPALLAQEGWYVTTDVVVPQKFQDVYNEWKQSGSTTKITRWALRNGKLDEEGASELGKNLEPVRFKLSCRYHDLLRLAETNHYSSCMDGNYGQQQLQYLADPDMAIVYVPDKAGKFSWRSLVRLVDNDGNGYALVHYRVYGNGPSQAIFRRLDKAVTIFQAYDIRHYHVSIDGTELKVSPTIHNNKFLSRPIWTDHKGIGWNRDRRIQVRVVKRDGEFEYQKQEVRRDYGAAPVFAQRFLVQDGPNWYPL